jgi:hypothetical protein
MLVTVVDAREGRVSCYEATLFTSDSRLPHSSAAVVQWLSHFVLNHTVRSSILSAFILFGLFG